VRGGRADLFGATTLTLPLVPTDRLVLTEGEFDAIPLFAQAGDLAAVATLGGASAPLSSRRPWALCGVRYFLVAYDLDAAGAAGAAALARLSNRMRAIRPTGGADLTEMDRNGIDLRAWLRHHLAGCS
ncbi:MAG: toprim domain-containing protein, partial [Chloroflexota bacterium]|nr:toprim domain-containing protein [Chloroflexota bacterium]